MAQSGTSTNPDAASILENQDVSGNVLDNDISESLVTRIQASTGPFADLGTTGTTIDGVYGSLTISPDGSYTYSANTAGADSLADGEVAYDVFTYTATDSQGSPSSNSLTLTVTGTNDVPTVNDDSVSTDQNATLSFSATDLLLNDTDVDHGDTLSVVGVSSGPDTHGTVSFANGTITYVPEQNYVGSATFTYTVSDSSGATATGTVNVSVAETQTVMAAAAATSSLVFEVRVAAADDDAEEGPTGGMKMPSANLDMVVDPNNSKLQTVGIRFTSIDIPQGAVITAAYIQFEAQKTSTGSLSLLIKGEDSDDAATFVKVADNITSRPLTDASVTWSPPDWTIDGEAGLAQRTPDLAAIIQEIVDRSGWTALGDMVFVISGTGGTRKADAYEGDAAGAPLLHIEYYLPDANNLPVAVNDSASVAEDTNTIAMPNPVAGNVLANDTDADADDTHAVSAVNGSSANVGIAVAGTYGTLVINSDGSYTYTLDNSKPEVQALAEGAVADDVFTYTNLDSQGGSSSASLTVSVTGTNDTPVAATDTLSTNGNTTLSFAASELAINDTDPDTGDTQTVTAVSGGANTHGTVSLLNGTITYTPDQDYIGPASFTYTLTDNHGATTTGTVNVTVLNNPPVAVDDSASVAEDTNTVALPNPATGNVLANDTDADGPDTHTVSAVNGLGANVGIAIAGAYGFLTLNSDGSYAYTLDNANPTVQALAEGAVIYDTFTYTNSDNNGGSSSASLTITVTGTNDGPTAVDDSVTANENTTLSFAASDLTTSDTDPDGGDTLTVTAVSAGAETHGTVSLLNGTVTYTPDQDYVGPASFTYTLADNHGATTTGTVNVNVTVFNNPPVAIDDSASVAEDTNTVAQPNPATGNVLANDTDEDGTDTHTVSAVNGLGTNVGIAIAGAYGFLTLNADGSYAYTLDNTKPTVQALAEGAVVYDTFTYTNSDNNGGSSSASLAITVTGINDAPIAIDDGGTVKEDTNTVALPNPAIGSVLLNDTDTDAGDTHIVSAVNGLGANVGIAVAGTYGSLTLNSDGSYAYTLDNANPALQALAEGQIVYDAFTYTDTDNHGASSSATLTISVTGTNDAPVAVNDSASVAEDTNTVALPNPVVGNVLTNDTDVDGVDTHTVSAVNGVGANVGIAVAGTYGSLTLNGDGSYSYTLDNNLPAVQSLAAGQLVNDVFSYTNLDNQGGSSGASLTIAITGTNDNPIATDDAVSANQNTTLSFSASDLLTNDSDPDSGDTLTVTAVSGGVDTHGTVSLANGTITYVPGQNYLGPATFTYTVADNLGAATTATVNVTVASPSEPVILETRIATGADDVEQRSTGYMYIDSSDIELVVDGTKLQSIGLRFTSVDIPQGAVITDAYIQFTAKKTSSGALTLSIHGQDSDAAAVFSSNAFDLTSRPLTDATVNWTPPDWTVNLGAGINERTPDITAIIQEIVDRSGWAALNDMVLVISGDSGTRRALAYEGSPTAAPLLHIEYYMPASGGGGGNPVLFNNPADANPGVNQIAELAVAGTPVGITASASDADAGTTITYSIDDIRFDINPGTGVITRSGTGTLDFETESSITLNVTATSSDGGWNTQAYSLGILNSPENVTFNDPADGDTANNRIYQNASAGTSTGITASASDPDAGSTVTYSIDDTRFAINQATGVVTRSNIGALNAQNEPSITVNVTATSSDGSTATHAYNIDVAAQAGPQVIYRFAVFGDYGDTSLNGEKAVAALIHSWNVDFVLTVGDNVYAPQTLDGAVGQQWHDYIGNYQGIYGAGSDVNRFFPTLGNHEYNEGFVDQYLSYFTLPDNERYYDYQIGPVHFFALNSNKQETDGRSSTGVQGQWAEAAMTASDASFNIAYFHHTAYNPSGTTLTMRWPYEDWGINAVFAGHQHNYYRENVDANGDGVELPYTTTGLGGAGRDVPEVGTSLVTITDQGMLIEFYTVSSYDGVNVTSVLQDSYFVPTPTDRTPTIVNGSYVLNGTDASDYLWGLGSNATIIGNKGSDTLVGGNDNNLFVFHAGDGQDTVVNFRPGAGTGDVLDLQAFGIQAVSDFQQVAVNQGTNVLADLGGGDTITLLGVQVAQFNDDNFLRNNLLA